MASDWCELTLEESMDAIIDYRGKTPKKTDSGIPLITAKIIKSGRIETVNEFISEDDYDTWMRRGIPNEGDVVMTTEAPLGEIAQLDGRKIALAQRVITLRGKKDILDNTFLKYLMISEYVQHQLDGRGTGTTVKGIKQSELRKVMLKFPSFIEQKAIAHILGSLDDKIEINRQMNETLEAMAQALFKSWFVDFDPVIDNALASGNAIPDEFFERAEQRKGIEKKDNADIQSLFPDEFEFTEEMGWIPLGWVIKSFSEIANLDTTSVKPNSEPEKTWEHFSIPAFDINASPAFDTGESIKSNKYKVNEVAILVSKLNPETERIWWVNIQDNSSAVCSTEFMQFIPKKPNHRAFIYSLLRSQYFQSEILSRVTGSTGSHQRTQPKSVAIIDILKPSDALVDEFSQIVGDWKLRVSWNIEQDSRLSKLRDTLLPKLMSGELRIPDADVMTKDV